MNIFKSISGLFRSPSGALVLSTTSSAIVTAATLAAQSGNPIGDIALRTATTLENGTLTGPQKKAAVIEAIVPVIITTAAKGGFGALAIDAEQFAALVVEEVVASMKQTPLVKMATALLAVFGVK